MAKIIFITSRYPYPISKGDQLRVFFQLKSLSEKNEIHLIALNDKKVTGELLEALSFCKSIHVYNISKLNSIISTFRCFFNDKPFQVGYFYNSSVSKKIQAQINQIAPDYIHCHLLRCAEYVKRSSGMEKTIDFMDAFSIGMKKRGDIEKNPVKKMLLLSEYKRLKKYESSLFNHFDRFAIISSQDADFINHPVSKEIAIVPNGVDYDSFYPRTDPKKYDICFMGNMSYPPNIEAINYTMKNLFPLLLERKYDVKFLIAGANPPSSIKKLQSKNIDVIDHFNHISDSIAMSRIMISPMVVSIGLQNKIIQAMAMKVPNVVSKAANNAVGAEHGKEVLEADEPTHYVELIMSLLDNKKYNSMIAENAYRFVKEKYDWTSVNNILEDTIKGQVK